jgi:hypothetical protein
MTKRTDLIKPLICTVEQNELLAIYTKRDVSCLTCIGRGIYGFMKRLIPSIREGRIGGVLVFCRIRYGKNSGLDLGNIRRLFIPFSDISEAQWILEERARDFIEVEYVFKNGENYEKND